jgi:hypothetical protein
MLVYLCFTLVLPSVVGIVGCYACVGIGTIDVVWMLDIFMKVGCWAWGLGVRSSRFMNLLVVAMHCLVILVYVVENMVWSYCQEIFVWKNVQDLQSVGFLACHLLVNSHPLLPTNPAHEHARWLCTLLGMLLIAS